MPILVKITYFSLYLLYICIYNNNLNSEFSLNLKIHELRCSKEKKSITASASQRIRLSIPWSRAKTEMLIKSVR